VLTSTVVGIFEAKEEGGRKTYVRNSIISANYSIYYRANDNSIVVSGNRLEGAQGGYNKMSNDWKLGHGYIYKEIWKDPMDATSLIGQWSRMPKAKDNKPVRVPKVGKDSRDSNLDQVKPAASAASDKEMKAWAKAKIIKWKEEEDNRRLVDYLNSLSLLELNLDQVKPDTNMRGKHGDE
jgi:hypothetical protein